MLRRTNAVCAMFVTVALLAGCNRRRETASPSPEQAEPPHDKIVAADEDERETPPPTAVAPERKARTTYASWYDVPRDSLAARRAMPGEYTAANDHYRIGTRLRVTHVANGRTVVVRVTDRGVPKGRAPLDLCKDAAAELDMLREGTAKVRVEILPQEAVAGAPPTGSPIASAEP